MKSPSVPVQQRLALGEGESYNAALLVVRMLSMFELAASLMLGGGVNRMKFLVCPASYPADAKESSCRGCWAINRMKCSSLSGLDFVRRGQEAATALCKFYVFVLSGSLLT